MSNRPLPETTLDASLVCGAKTKMGEVCDNEGMKNGRCWLHGGLSTGPKTPEGLARCGNWKHGLYSKQMREHKQFIKEICRDAMDAVRRIN